MSRRFPNARRWVRQDPICTVGDCEKKVNARGLCSAHYVRWRKHGDTLVLLPNGRWSGEDPSYTAVHHRINRTRGRASRSPCVDCSRPAQEWSYTGGDPDERISNKGFAYSLNFDLYVTRCCSCHRKKDRKQRGKKVSGAAVAAA